MEEEMHFYNYLIISKYLLSRFYAFERLQTKGSLE